MTEVGDRAVVAPVDVDFTCLDVVADRHAAAPTATLRMRVEEHSGVQVYAVALRCQVRVEPLRRLYSDDEADKIVDLFGGRARWGSTMQSLQLGFLSQVLPGFTGEAEFALALPLSYDVDVAAHKYLTALEDSEVPLNLLFSGQVFSGAAGSIQVQPVPWHKETQARMPVSVWRDAMDVHFPGQAWVRISRDRYDRLATFRGRYGLIGWDDVVDHLLEDAGT